MPSPLIAMSRLLPVEVMLPCVKRCATCAIFTPLPVCVLLVPCGETAKSSENWAAEDLNPVVAELATLLAVTLRLLCAASMPLSAIPKAIVMLLVDE